MAPDTKSIDFVHFTVTLNERAELVIPVLGSIATTLTVYTFVAV